MGGTSCKVINKSDDKPEHDKEFVRGIESANKNCPIDIANGLGSVDSIKLVNDYVTFYASYKTLNPLFKEGDMNKIKEALVSYVLTEDKSKKLVNMILDENCGLKMVATEANENNKTTVTIPLDELKKIRDDYYDNPQKTSRKTIEMQLKAEKASLPMIIDEGMTMTDYILEDNNVVFIIKIDESLYSMNDFKKSKDLMKSAIINEGLQDPQAQIMVNLCKSANMGLVYRMIGNRSNKKINIEISSDELR